MGKSASRNRLRIGFLSCKNYFDRLTFSGILYCMYHSLGRQADLVPLGHPYPPTRLRELLAKIGKGKQQRIDDESETALIEFGRDVERQLEDAHVDLVFAPVASRELHFVNLRQPIVYASDVTCRLLYDNYDFGLSAEQLAVAENAEQLAIQNSRAITYPSAWAAESAMRDYGASKDKIRVIPYGANLLMVPDANEIYNKCDRRPWNIVFIGLYWHRKGGDIALKAFEALRSRGVDVEMTFIGTEPPEGHGGLPVRALRFLDKRRARDRKTLRKILLSSHVMLFPSRSDCSPIALCEAATYGIPVVAADVGGISSIVTERTGRLMPSDSSPEDYAAAVMDLIGDRERYRDLVRSSRQRYDEVLNWDKWAESLIKFCEQLI